MNIGHANHAAIVLPDGRVVAGGDAIERSSDFVSTAIVDFYNPRSRTFTAGAPLFSFRNSACLRKDPILRRPRALYGGVGLAVLETVHAIRRLADPQGINPLCI